MLTHIYGIQKYGAVEPIWRQQYRHRHREQTYGHGEGVGREGGMYGETYMETYTLPYVKHVAICEINCQWSFAMWLRGLKLGLCNNLERRDGEGSRRNVQEGGDIGIPMVIHVDIWQKPTKFCRAITLN